MRAVIRYNTFDNSGFVYHGADTSAYGVRHVEVYNNTFIFSPSGTGYNFPLNLNWWFYMRGGSGVWTDNDMPDIKSQIWGNKPEIKMIVQNIPSTSRPVSVLDNVPGPVKLGNRTMVRTIVRACVHLEQHWRIASAWISDYNPDECGSSTQTVRFIQRAATTWLALPKPGYTKYAYPHPLTAGRAVISFRRPTCAAP